MTGDLSDVLTARLAGDVQGTDNLSMIAAANELDFRDGLACEDLAALKRILGGISGRCRGVLAIAGRLTAERDKALVQVAEYEGGTRIDDPDEPWVKCAGHEWVEWPCDTLRNLLSAYRYMPGFKEEWLK